MGAWLSCRCVVVEWVSNYLEGTFDEIKEIQLDTTKRSSKAQMIKLANLLASCLVLPQSACTLRSLLSFFTLTMTRSIWGTKLVKIIRRKGKALDHLQRWSRNRHH